MRVWLPLPAKVSPIGAAPTSTWASSACWGSLSRRLAEKPSSALLSRLVTHTVVPSVMARTGSQPASAVVLTALAGSVSASAVSSTETVPSPWAWLAAFIMLVTYISLASGENVSPTGCWSRLTLPTTADEPNPWVSAVCRLNTAMAALSCRVTNTNLSSGEMPTSTAPLPNELVSVPTIAWLLPCSAAAVSTTTAPLFRAATRYFPLWVRVAAFCRPGTVMTCSTAGASPDPWASTTIAPSRVTNVNLPSAVVLTPNGCAPTATDCVRTVDSDEALATVDRQPGAVMAGSTAAGVLAWVVSAAPVALSFPPPPPCSAANAPMAPATTTSPAAAAGQRRRWRRAGRLGPGGRSGPPAASGPAGPRVPPAGGGGSDG